MSEDTSIHGHVVGHAEGVVQDAPEAPSVQAAGASPREMSDETFDLCPTDWGHGSSGHFSSGTFHICAR